jgi:hypothetical protein
MNLKNAARELGAAGVFSAVDQEHLAPFIEHKLTHSSPQNRDAWVQFFDELGEEIGKHASHSKLGHEVLKFASDLKHAQGDQADRALHQLNVGQVN